MDRVRHLPKKAIWIGLAFFSMLGPYSIYRAIEKYGSNWVRFSFQAVWRDPIYTYAAVDLGAIFSVVTYWAYLDCKRTGRRFWFWPVLFFIFGTPAFLLFKLSEKPTNKN